MIRAEAVDQYQCTDALHQICPASLVLSNIYFFTISARTTTLIPPDTAGL